MRKGLCPMSRHDGRKATQLRSMKIQRGYTRHPAGSVLVRCGETIVLCTASWSAGVPDWKKGAGSGWVTAEYDMLPAATHDRRRRNRTAVDGRTQEIQRLIGRSLRAVTDLEALGENSIFIDCDVLQADGGTRTTSINGAFVALCDAVSHARRQGLIDRSPIREAVAALQKAGQNPALMVDCSHANSNKQPAQQEEVARSVIAQRVAGNLALIGLMIESYLQEGNQPLPANPADLRYGVSITDACVSWETTERMLRWGYEKLSAGKPEAQPQPA